MLKAIEATIEPDGQVRLREPVRLSHVCRAIVTIIDDAAESRQLPQICESALLSEAALAQDWNRTEEEEAWSHLQPVQ